MWREGFDLNLLAWILNALALAFGALLGFRALVDPKWAARLVRLKEDEQGGGFAEFRATYGGLFLLAHLAALFFSLNWIAEGETAIGMYAAGASAVLCAAWIGAAGGRLWSCASDATLTRFNLISAAVEVIVGVLIGAPWLFWNFRAPG